MFVLTGIIKNPVFSKVRIYVLKHVTFGEPNRRVCVLQALKLQKQPFQRENLESNIASSCNRECWMGHTEHRKPRWLIVSWKMYAYG